MSRSSERARSTRYDVDAWQPPENTIDRRGQRCETCRAWAGVGGRRGQCLAQELEVDGRRAYRVTLGQDGAACPDYIRAAPEVVATELAAFERQRDHERAVRDRAAARRMTPRRRKVLDMLARPEGATRQDLELAGVIAPQMCVAELRRLGYVITSAPDPNLPTRGGPSPHRYHLAGEEAAT